MHFPHRLVLLALFSLSKWRW